MSLALLFHYLLLNMFRMLVHPSSGACDLLWIYFMFSIALVRCVLVLRCGSAGVVWYPYAGWSVASACIRIPLHLSLSWASVIQSIPPHPISWRSILILSSIYAWVSPLVIPSDFPTKSLYTGYRHTLTICNSHCVCTTTIVARTYVSVTSYVHCLLVAYSIIHFTCLFSSGLPILRFMKT